MKKILIIICLFFTARSYAESEALNNPEVLSDEQLEEVRLCLDSPSLSEEVNSNAELTPEQCELLLKERFAYELDIAENFLGRGIRNRYIDEDDLTNEGIEYPAWLEEFREGIENSTNPWIKELRKGQK